MIEHRHVWPNGTFSNWHKAESAHSKPEYARDTEFETREKGETGKRPTPIRPNLKQDPEVARAKYQLERID